MMRGRGCICVMMFSLLTLALILENNQTYALYALPSHWMRQPKTRFYSETVATPEPSTQPAPEQKGTIFRFSNSLKPDPLENPDFFKFLHKSSHRNCEYEK